MSKNKKNPHEPVRVINAETRTVKREKHVVEEKTKGDTVVKWLFGVLIVLAVAYMVWSMYIVG